MAQTENNETMQLLAESLTDPDHPLMAIQLKEDGLVFIAQSHGGLPNIIKLRSTSGHVAINVTRNGQRVGRIVI